MLTGLKLVVKPLADAIAHHTCDDRQYEGNHRLHCTHLLPVWARRGPAFTAYHKILQITTKNGSSPLTWEAIRFSFSLRLKQAHLAAFGQVGQHTGGAQAFQHGAGDAGGLLELLH